MPQDIFSSYTFDLQQHLFSRLWIHLCSYSFCRVWNCRSCFGKQISWTYYGQAYSCPLSIPYDILIIKILQCWTFAFLNVRLNQTDKKVRLHHVPQLYIYGYQDYILIFTNMGLQFFKFIEKVCNYHFAFRFSVSILLWRTGWVESTFDYVA